MDQPQSQAEIARRLLTEIRSLIYNVPEHTKGHIELIKATLGSPSQTQLLVSALIGVVLLFQVYIRFRNVTANRKSRFLASPGFPLPEALSDFDWATQEPPQLRPFRPKYHLTMALENMEPSELIPMDKTYKERLQYRRKILKEHREIVIAMHDESDPRITAAVSEFYRYIMSTYLPVRYPTMFRLHETTFETGKAYMLENLVLNELYPSEVTQLTSPMRALEILYKTVDEDFLILLPEESDSDSSPSSTEGSGKTAAATVQTKYRLIAYENCYPAGFNPRKKLGKLLADIHAPVPGYQDKLEKSMDRYFANIEVGKYVKRVNWSISTDTELFAAFGGLHSSENENQKEEKIKEGQLDVDSTKLRCERQTLHRLPKSRALVFGFHTYTYPIKQIKEEGLGEDLATAIDGLKTGSIPAIHDYKRGAIWGDAVKAYLRS
ncbi:hypothetical protein UA08_01723 [Talaromyces atroroseus]|uniref:HRQ family protein 2 n=1 Tax=Talaromyces atroroseus TaxID=1441469 RepID=A0A1Q5QAD0_TALAT|nr:hypothetical protein UA08_01723 [Talaromyces atroroseus]OKL62851.1 hypothetical protein UA08_01723 [Talaromyces atroroseus]